MSAIYIHIPFCKTRCNYCDFYSQTSTNIRPAVIQSLVKEIYLRRDYLPGRNIKTIYFGGGTPSLLSKDEFEQIFEAVNEVYVVEQDAEITLEANPDDLTCDYLSSIAALPFNRISIGIQSFNDYELGLMNRRHNAAEALQSVENARRAGFGSISIDLMYGLPYQTLKDWEKQLDTALACGVQHLSAYGLTYEEGTVFQKLLDKDKLEAVDDDTMSGMYKLLLDKTKEHGFEAYEISNFALPGYHSRHNSHYWSKKPYIGIGPSAHSYNGSSRQWNISSAAEYCSSLSRDVIPCEHEELSLYEQYNDFVMIKLRTSGGLNMDELEAEFGPELKAYCLENIKTFIETEKAYCTNNVIRLSTEGVLISNLILAELMKV